MLKENVISKTQGFCEVVIKISIKFLIFKGTQLEINISLASIHRSSFSLIITTSVFNPLQTLPVNKN